MAESAKRAVTGYAVSTWGSQEKTGERRGHMWDTKFIRWQGSDTTSGNNFRPGCCRQGDSSAQPLSRIRGLLPTEGQGGELPEGNEAKTWQKPLLKVAETDKRKRATIKFSRRFVTAAPFQCGCFSCEKVEESVDSCRKTAPPPADCKLLLHQKINKNLWTAARMIYLQ